MIFVFFLGGFETPMFRYHVSLGGSTFSAEAQEFAVTWWLDADSFKHRENRASRCISTRILRGWVHQWVHPKGGTFLWPFSCDVTELGSNTAPLTHEKRPKTTKVWVVFWLSYGMLWCFTSSRTGPHQQVVLLRIMNLHEGSPKPYSLPRNDDDHWSLCPFPTGWSIYRGVPQWTPTSR